ncbi:MAG TPA: hypothetical protein VFF13_05070 [archaeon]|nr:hypothetical protein [archaeon]
MVGHHGRTHFDRERKREQKKAEKAQSTPKNVRPRLKFADLDAKIEMVMTARKCNRETATQIIYSEYDIV